MVAQSFPSQVASGTNRTPVIARRRHSSIQSRGQPGGAPTTFSKPFPLPAYLSHSTYASQFFTTIPASSPTSEYPPIKTSPDSPSSNATAAPSIAVHPDDADDNLPGSSSSRAHDDDAKVPILLPTCWDEGDRCQALELNSDGLGVSFAGSSNHGDRDAAAVRSNRPIPSQAAVYYFEVKIENKGQSGYIGIGFSHRTVSLERLPGWQASSWGYHGDDGRAFCSTGTGETYGPTFTTGDVIGCGVDFTDAWPEDSFGDDLKGSHKEGGRAFFTKNGEFLGYAFSNLTGKLYPSVGLRTAGEMVRANFGSEPFVFPIDALVRDRQRTVMARVASSTIPPSLLLPPPEPPIPTLYPVSQEERLNETLQALITSYLVHHGYSATAESFATQVKEERKERGKGLLGPSAIVEDEAMDVSGALASTWTSDASVRGDIRKAFLTGDMERVLDLTQRHYPSLLTEDLKDPSGGLKFKLRTRAFIEAVVRSLPGSNTSHDLAPAPLSHQHFSTPPTSPKSATIDLMGLEGVLSLGRSLSYDFKDDQRPLVQSALEEAFSLIAYTRLNELQGRLAWLVSMEAREALADELNSAVLVSLSLPPIPHLEAAYRHCSATVSWLGELGSGAAAFVDVRREVLSP
ncbi:competence/damage-inducible protein CinA [Meredithblackwellia eburnea MCA 4105]